MEKSLVTLYTTYCERNNLPKLSCDEMLIEVELTTLQRKWFEAYLQIWNLSDI